MERRPRFTSDNIAYILQGRFDKIIIKYIISGARSARALRVTFWYSGLRLCMYVV